MSRTVRLLLTSLTAVSLAAASAPAFADEDPPPPPPPACYDAEGSPIYDPEVCAGRQASGH